MSVFARRVVYQLALLPTSRIEWGCWLVISVYDVCGFGHSLLDDAYEILIEKGLVRPVEETLCPSFIIKTRWARSLLSVLKIAIGPLASPQSGRCRRHPSSPMDRGTLQTWRT